MLSHDLKNVAAALQMGIDGKSLNERSLREVVRQLRTLADDAEQLEAAAIAPAAQLGGHNMPDNVVRIATVLAKKGVTVGPRPIGGGDAA